VKKTNKRIRMRTKNEEGAEICEENKAMEKGEE
jgi:hypothetical protein